MTGITHPSPHYNHSSLCSLPNSLHFNHVTFFGIQRPSSLTTTFPLELQGDRNDNLIVKREEVYIVKSPVTSKIYWTDVMKPSFFNLGVISLYESGSAL